MARARHTWLVIALCVAACSGCGDGNGASPDGSTDTGTETGTGSDTGSETDTSTWVSDAGPWEWEDNPPGEDCGPGCKQLTFTKEVGTNRWDIWGENLFYLAGTKNEDNILYLVEIPNNRRMRIPDIFPQYPSSNGSSSIFYPTLFENTYYYSLRTFSPAPKSRFLVRIDIQQQIQSVVFDEEDNGPDLFEPLEYLDIYSNRIISQGGCGAEALNGNTLCLFDVSTATAGVQTLIDDDYGNYNSIWDGVLVFTDSRAGFKITGYDIAAQQFLTVTDDSEYSQLSPRIQGRKVVYGDLRFGTNQDPVMGNRNHEAVFAYDLDTQERTQITNAQWIAGNPDIWNEIVVWMDYRECDNPNDVNDFSNVQIWGYNLETQAEFRITDLPADAWPDRPKDDPRIWGYRVYVDMTTISPDTYDSIFVFDLPEGAR